MKKGEGVGDLINVLKSQRIKFKVTYDVARKQYEPHEHDIFDRTKRPDKLVQQYRGKNSKGAAIYETVSVAVARAAIPYQKLIVERIIGTMLGNNIQLTEENLAGSEVESDLFKQVKQVWEDSKMDFTNRSILRALLSEMEVAEIWYAVKNEYGEIELKCRVVSPSKGDRLYPFFDDNGTLIAFSREYEIEKEPGTKIIRLDTYTKESILKFQNADSGWQFLGGITNSFGKLPVVYYYQLAPEWMDIQPSCDRQDTLVSNFSDTNDYFASPMVKVRGKVEGFADKGEQGKIITVGENGDVDYLTWNSGPEAIKTEFDINEDLIYSSMQIPNFSWSKVQNIGNLQNAILKLFFTDPHMKAETKWETFGIGIQRRLNLLSRACKELFNTKTTERQIKIKPVMKPYVPENLSEIVQTLVTATNGEPVMSQKRAVELNPMVSDTKAEMERLDEESVKRQSESFNMAGE